jgi:hypothetical protein
MASSPRAIVTGQLQVDLEVSVDGDADLEVQPDNPNKFDVEIYGDAELEAELFNDGIIEMATDIEGEGFMFFVGPFGSEAADFYEAYYQYIDVGVGFDATDVDPTLDSQSFDDGFVANFARYLYQYVDVGVGFDYTDDISFRAGFVSQSYPDGDIIRDWARALYQYLNVIAEADRPYCRLTIGPAPRGHKDLTPTPRPPRNR